MQHISLPTSKYMTQGQAHDQVSHAAAPGHGQVGKAHRHGRSGRRNRGRFGRLVVVQSRSSPTAVVQVESQRPSLLIFEIRAKIAREGMEWMARRVDPALDAQEQIDLLL